MIKRDDASLKPVMKNLAGKTALITGGTKRVGRAIALACARQGVNLVIHYNKSEKEAEALGREASAMGVKTWKVKADFSGPREYGTLVERALAAAGTLDCLINNASVFSSDTLEDANFENLVRNVEVNAWAPLLFSRDFARLCRKGKIINILDSKIKGFDWSHASYILSKQMFGVITKMCAVRFAPDITVNSVAPGLILPPAGKDDSYLDSLAGSVPLKRHGGPDDVAGTVLYFLENDFVTGQVIYVDGGRHLMDY